MSFSGFSQEIVGFLDELKANNDKAWFDANRSRFDELVIAPSLQLVASLSRPLSQMRPALKAVPKVNGSIRRIHRDTRFSKDKTPYHTHLHLVFWAGEHSSRSPGVHVILAEDHFGFGAGHWAFDDAALQRYRVQVIGDGGKAVAAAIEAVRPLGVELDEPELCYKGLVMKANKRPYPSALFGPGAVDHIAGLCVGLEPLNRYLTEHVYS